MSIQIGIIGGSGLYDMEELKDRKEVHVSTPFGDPSGPYVTATLRGRRVVFLARHGAGHRLLPSELNYRANIYGFKTLGVEWLLSASAVGSLKQEYAPLDLVLPDQFFDRTVGRVSTFFGRGLAAHVSFAHPVCPSLHEVAHAAAAKAGATAHKGGTYVCMEGPAFSTKSESESYRTVGLRRHRHDEPAGGQARARGRDLLRHDRARDRLRLLAPGPRPRHGGHGHRQPAAERGDRAARHRERRRVAAHRPHLRVRVGARRRRSSRAATRSPRQTRRELEPIVGKYLS